MKEIVTTLSLFQDRDGFISLPEEKDPFYIGLEIEANFSPHSVKERQLRKLLGENADMRQVIRDFLHQSKDFYIERVEADLSKDELVFKPISVRAHEYLIPDYQELLNLMIVLGYHFESSIFEEVGIHHNINKKTFTVSSFDNFITTCFNHRFELLSIANRKDYSTRSADIQWMLGDKGFLQTTHLEKRFKREKTNLIKAFKSEEQYQSMGIQVKPNDTIELSWWGSTSNSQEVWKQIKFTSILIDQLNKKGRPLYKDEFNKVLNMLDLTTQSDLLPQNIEVLPEKFGGLLNI